MNMSISSALNKMLQVFGLLLVLQSCSSEQESSIMAESGAERCGVYQVRSYKTFLPVCKLPTAAWDGKGPALRTEVSVNCKKSDDYIYNKTYTWSECLNEVTYPTSKPALTTGGGCLFDQGVGCQINQTLPSIDPSFADSSPEGLLLSHTYSQIQKAVIQVNAEGGIHLDQRLKMLDSANLFADVALEQFKNGQDSAASSSISVALKIVDAATNFVPGVSLVKDSIVIVSGVNPITGEQVSDVERAMTLGTLLLPSVASASVKQFEKVAATLVKIASAESKSAKIAEGLIKAIKKSDDELADLVNLTPCQASESNYRSFRLLNPINWFVGEALAASPCKRFGTITAEIVEAGEKNLVSLKAGNTGFGVAVRKDYSKTYRQHYASLDGEIGQVHHAVEQQVLTQYPGVITEVELNSLANLRGIPKGAAGTKLHQAELRKEWDKFYEAMKIAEKIPTKAELLKYAKIIDDKYGNQFIPAIR